MNKEILKVENLSKSYKTKKHLFAGAQEHVAVRDVSFTLHDGEVLGIVGESGCGKSTLVKSIIRMIEPDSGSIELFGRDFLKLKGKDLKRARRDIRMIFQDPYSSLNPRMTVFDIIAEPLCTEGRLSKKEIADKVTDTMKRVGLDLSFARRYPHEFSGGQRQRIVIARAIITNPRIIICDEPVSALDVSIQAKVLNLLNDLKDELGISYIFISHDLEVVRHIADRVVVMKDGEFIEQGTCSEVFDHARSSYTKELIDSIPVIPKFAS